ncbi:hypothetical protein HDU98_005541 [Podochytrium sp. JEL0797]|nr:hypothetical protein HDU98_005541 [Podochytrium sp. JEL0797]
MLASSELAPKNRVASIKLSLTQDMFNEVSHLITPIAEAFILSMKIEDQIMKKKVFLLGEKEFATAKNIQISKFDIQDCLMKIEDGFISIEIKNVAFGVDMDMEVAGGELGTVSVKADVDVTAKIKFGLKDKHCTTDVYDIKSTMSNFDTEVGTGFAGKIVSEIVEALEFVLRGVIENCLESTITTSLEEGLDSILVRNWDILGSVSTVFYKMAVGFVAAPVISKERGVEYEIGVDSFFNKEKAYVSEEIHAKGCEVLSVDGLKVTEEITPIAQAYIMSMKIEDQHMKKKVLLLGEKEFATAKNIQISKFDIHACLMKIEDGFISIEIKNVAFGVDMDMHVLHVFVGKELGKVRVTADVDVTAKIKFGLNGKHCMTDVYDMKATLHNFDSEVGTGFAGKIISEIIEALEFVLRDEIEKCLESTITTSLEEGLDSILVRDWDILGKMSTVFYKMAVEFVAAPVISKERGVEYEIGVNSFFNKKKTYVVDEMQVKGFDFEVSSFEGLKVAEE